MSFATISDMARSRKQTFTVDVVEPRITAESMPPRWYEVRYWSKRRWVVVSVVVILVITVIVAVSVVMSRRNSHYPDYLPLAYGLSTSCLYFLFNTYIAC
jgi:hypothetical protein